MMHHESKKISEATEQPLYKQLVDAFIKLYAELLKTKTPSDAEDIAIALVSEQYKTDKTNPEILVVALAREFWNHHVLPYAEEIASVHSDDEHAERPEDIELEMIFYNFLIKVANLERDAAKKIPMSGEKALKAALDDASEGVQQAIKHVQATREKWLKEVETERKIQLEQPRNSIQDWIEKIVDDLSKIQTQNEHTKMHLNECRLDLTLLLHQAPGNYMSITFAKNIMHEVIHKIETLHANLFALDIKKELIGLLENRGIFCYHTLEHESKDPAVHFTLDYELDFLKSKAGAEMSAGRKANFEKFCKVRTHYLALISKLNDKSIKLHQRETAREKKTIRSKVRSIFKSKDLAVSDQSKKDLANDLSRDLKTKSLAEIKAMLPKFKADVATIPRSSLFANLFCKESKCDTGKKAENIIACKNPTTRDLVQCIVETANELVALIDKLQFKAPLPENSPYVIPQPVAQIEVKV